MDGMSYLVGAIGFVVVAGYTAVQWLRHGRDHGVTDDASILLAAPPEGMTAATATIVDHQPTSVAFMAALLDLASRNEIRFQAEPGGGLVGIELQGGGSTDPQVRLNRRRPIGEGEAYVLTQLKEAPLAAAIRSGPAGSAQADPAVMAQGLGTMMQFLSFAAREQAGDDSMAARSAREQGLLDGPPLAPGALGTALEQASARPLSAEQQAAIAKFGFMTEALQNPASIAADPEAFAARIEAASGKSMSARDLDEMKAWASRAAAESTTAPASTGPGLGSGLPPTGSDQYISGEAALHLGAPLFFGTLLETYARRHGWISGFSFFKRLRWHLTGAAEVVVGVILLGVGSAKNGGAILGLGVGVAVAGFATYLIAPAMTAATAEGSLVRAQIAAYRRTLQMTYATAQSMADVAGTAGLAWLETPDQSLVWGIALGLRSEIEALLGRTAGDLQASQAAPAAYQPTWYAGPTGAGPADPAAMFAGIEAIGSEAGGARRASPV